MASNQLSSFAHALLASCVIATVGCGKAAGIAPAGSSPSQSKSGAASEEATAAHKVDKCVDDVLKIKSGQAGPRPPFNENMIKDALKYKLIDPFSARYEISKPRRGIFDCGKSGKSEAHWMVPVLVNAKNRLGGYTGWTQYLFIWGPIKGTNQWSPDLFEFRAEMAVIFDKTEADVAKKKILQSIVWVD
jgi:hypothetical protein